MTPVNIQSWWKSSARQTKWLPDLLLLSLSDLEPDEKDRLPIVATLNDMARKGTSGVVDELSWLHRYSNGKLIRNDFAGTELGYHSNEIIPCKCLALDHRVTNGWIIFRINFSSDGIVRDNDASIAIRRSRVLPPLSTFPQQSAPYERSFNLCLIELHQLSPHKNTFNNPKTMSYRL